MMLQQYHPRRRITMLSLMKRRLHFTPSIFVIGTITTILLLLLCATIVNSQQEENPDTIQNEINTRVIQLIESTPSTEPIILRVDEITDELVDRASNITNDDDKFTFVINGLQFTNIWDSVLIDTNGNIDLALFVNTLLDLPLPEEIEPYPGFLESRQEAIRQQNEDGRDFTNRILTLYDNVVTEYGNSIELPFLKAPFYQLSYGYENATNAKVAGTINDRCVIFLNLGARNMLLQSNTFDIATIHETWHCFQTNYNGNGDLLANSIREGIVTFLTSITANNDNDNSDNGNDNNYTDPELLFWSNEEYDSAQIREDEIIKIYQEQRLTSDPTILNQWIIFGIPLSYVSGSPSRCGYYVGLLIVRAYYDNNVINNNNNDNNNSITSIAEILLDISSTPEGREEMWQIFAKQEGLLLDDNNVQSNGNDDDNDTSDSNMPLLQTLSSLLWQLLLLLFNFCTYF